MRRRAATSAIAACPKASRRSKAFRQNRPTSPPPWRVAPYLGRQHRDFSQAEPRRDAAPALERLQQPEHALAAAKFLSASLLLPASVLRPAPSALHLAAPPPQTGHRTKAMGPTGRYWARKSPEPVPVKQQECCWRPMMHSVPQAPAVWSPVNQRQRCSAVDKHWLRKHLHKESRRNPAQDR